MPIGWALAAAVVTAVSVAGVGILGMNSESAGMEAANLAALPLGFVCSAAPVALVVHFLVKRGPARVAAPVGCGCLGGIGLLAGLFVFWSAIWPSL
jgi:hypothetical protein